MTFANVISLTALFVALGGVAWGAATIGTQDVIDGSLRSKDLKDGHGVRDRDVHAGGLTGAAIDESTLAQVPGAADADTLDGNGPGAFLGSDQVVWASVNANGTLARGSAGMSSFHTISNIDGLYFVQLPAGFNAISCSYVGSVGRAEYNADSTDQLSGSVSAQPYTGNQSDIRYVVVQTRTLDGAKADRPFHLAVFCS